MSCDNPFAFAALAALAAALYIASGVTQPLLTYWAKDAGLADPKCQLYMMFYYMGPASVALTLVGDTSVAWPTRLTLLKAGGIAVVDIFAQSMNYTGSTLCGPTIFAIIYSSVTVWTAVFSRFFLGRPLVPSQWAGVISVFAGLTITALDSVAVGPGVFRGSCLVLVGSIMHASTYVLSEVIMTKGEAIPVRINCAAQGIVACGAFVAWQLLYTRPRYETLIRKPMEEAGTTVAVALVILGSIGLANLVHALTFFHTLKHFPHGATSAGVMKGLQAVLVFVSTWAVFCGRTGGAEMCFTRAKMMSLVVVVGGVLIFGRATEQGSRAKGEGLMGEEEGLVTKDGYRQIGEVSELEINNSPHV